MICPLAEAEVLSADDAHSPESHAHVGPFDTSVKAEHAMPAIHTHAFFSNQLKLWSSFVPESPEMRLNLRMCVRTTVADGRCH